MSRVAIHLFGVPQILRDGAPVQVERRKALALLAYLALTRRPLTRDELAALLWPDLDQQRARTMLRHALSALQRAVGHGWLILDGDQVALPPHPDLWIDVVRFHTLLDQVADHGHPPAFLCDQCIAALSEAVALHESPFLSGFSLADCPDYEAWQTYQTEALQRQLAAALAQLTAVHAQGGRRQVEKAIEYARRWIAVDPLCEAAHRALIRLLAANGDRTAALQQYDQCVAQLAADLGVEPEEETQRLARQVRTGEWTSVGPEAVAGRVARLSGHALPAQSSPFMGREHESLQVIRCLQNPSCRLLTICGPGGIGKTRLAIQAAQSEALAYTHGTWFVNLAPVASADLFLPTLLSALDAPGLGPADPRRRLLDYLRGKQMLIVLDSFEHLVEAAPALSDLVHAAPGVKFLVTSRIRLNLADEWLESLSGLALPPAPSAGAAHAPPASLDEYPATRLFLHCVQRLQPDFEPRAQDVAAIGGICRQLDGIPLAIELAAGWLHTLPPAEVQAEVARGFGVLTTSARDVDSRHRSMRGVLDHSWQLLTPQEQNILRQFSVFRGGCTRDGLVTVTGAGLEDLATLIDKSWLHVTPSGRYEMHELSRQYCAGQLDQNHTAATGEAVDQVYRRHAAYYGRALATPMRTVNYARSTLDDVAVELGNIQTALRWAAVAHDVTAVRWLSMSLYFVAEMLGRFREIVELYQTVIDQLAPEIADQSDRLRWQEAALIQGYILWHQSNLLIYFAQVQQCRQLLEYNRTLLAQVEPSEDQRFLDTLSEFVLAIQRLRSGDFVEAEGMFDAVLERFVEPTMPHKLYERSIEPLHMQAQILSFLGHASFHLGDYAKAEERFHLSREIREELGERRFYAHHTNWLVYLLQVLGRYAEAENLAQDALERVQIMGDYVSEINALLALGRLEREMGRYTPARGHLEKSLAMAKHCGHFNLILDLIGELGRLELALEHPQAAWTWGQEALAIYAEGDQVHSNHLSGVLGMMGWAALGEHDTARARIMFRRLLRFKGRLALHTLEAVAGMARSMVLAGQPAQAAPLLVLVVQHPATAFAMRDTARRWLAEIRPQLPAEAVAALDRPVSPADLDAVVAGLLRPDVPAPATPEV